MATAKSDDESDVSSHPLAENRPGVYVQVVSPRRRKKNKRGESASSSRPAAGKARGGVREETDARVGAGRRSDPRVADSEETVLAPNPLPPLSEPPDSADDPYASPSEAPTVVGHFSIPAMALPATEASSAGGAPEDGEEEDNRHSGERPVDLDSMRARAGGSENSNHRPDLSGMSLPPPPRLPSFAREEPSEPSGATPLPLPSASLLDAPPTLRPVAPEPTHATRPSATLLAFVAAFTAIIVTAGLVALRERTRTDSEPGNRTPAAVGTPAQASTVGSADQTSAVGRPAQPAVGAPVATSSAGADGAPAAAVPAAASALPAQAGISTVPPGAQKPERPTRKAAGRALVAKANAALRQLADMGVKATPGAEPEPAASEEERVPQAGEPLELPVNPY